MGKVDVSKLSEAFRQSRNQCLTAVTMVYPNSKPQTKRGNVSSDKYNSFLRKYANLEDSIDSFNSQDLMYFFREKAREAGIKYVISNMKRDMGIFKKLSSNYTPREICLMIEFIFFSEQNYLDREITQPTVLSSGWCNRIYRDSLLWVEDKYVPEIPKHRPKREYDGNSSVNNAEIGEWDD